MKKLFASLTLIAAFSAGQLLAQNNGDPAADDKAWREHRQSVLDIQDQLWAKSMEYEALIANPNAKRSDVTDVIGEMTKLRRQMRTEQDKFSGRDYGRGWGYGPGRGHRGGYHGGGYCGLGYGPGWDRDDDRGRGGRPGRGYGGWGGHHRNW